jgi:hypothetical protein
MTPKEKASDLVIDFYQVQSTDCYYGVDWEMAKQCALIAVDEILESCYLEKEWFFEEVKEEINKL